MSRKLLLLMLLALLVGTLNLATRVEKAKASGTIYIRADGSLDPPTAPISSVDNMTYVFADNITSDGDGVVLDRDNIVVDGAGYTLQGTGVWGSNGIGLTVKSNVTIKNIRIKDFWYGIYLESSSDTRIVGNNITNNDYGISLYSSLDTRISGNNITANNEDGILIYSSSYNNSISGNNIKDGDNGIYVSGSSNNTVHHNKFTNNTRQVYSDGSPNVWDNGYPSGGNYWSDYVGNDTYSGPYQNETGRDGIGDTPYVIDENNRDRYPMIPEHELAVSITAPIYLHPGSPSSLDAIVTNDGFNDEANVNLILFINGTTPDSATIPLLQAGNSYTLSYVWTPTVEGTYNVTVYASPVSGEISTENNQETAFVSVVVSVPFGMQVGVKAGDWIKCTYTISGWPAGTAYPKWLKVEFQSVEGTNATVRVTMHMSDGTEQNSTVPVDVVAGGQALGLSGFVIPANATTGDSVYMSGYGNVTVAGETTRSFAGASRAVVYTSFSQYGTQLEYYWDKQTGVLVEATVVSGSMTATGETTETNIWQAAPSGLPIAPIYLYVLAALAIVIAVGAAVFIMRRKKKPPEEVENSRSKLRLTRTGFRRNLGHRITRV